jgi:hypothetical protein
VKVTRKWQYEQKTGTKARNGCIEKIGQHLFRQTNSNWQVSDINTTTLSRDLRVGCSGKLLSENGLTWLST